MTDRKQSPDETTENATEEAKYQSAREAAKAVIERHLDRLDDQDDIESYANEAARIEDELVDDFGAHEDAARALRGAVRLFVTALVGLQQERVKWENHHLDEHSAEADIPFTAVGNDEMPYPNMEPTDLINWILAGKPETWTPGQPGPASSATVAES